MSRPPLGVGAGLCAAARHHVESGPRVGRRFVRQSGMHRHRGEQVWVARAQNRGHGAARREPGDEHALGIDRASRVAVDEIADDRSDRCRLAGIALLVLGEEPVPASLRVAAAILARVDDHEAVAVGGVVHERGRRERSGVLRAAMQHADERCSRHGVQPGRHVNEHPTVALSDRQDVADRGRRAREGARIEVGQ